MESGARVLGHSIHPILIVFPLGLLSTGVVFDFIHLLGGGPTFTLVAYWMIMSGLVGGMLAAIFGWVDWFVIPSNSRAKKVGLLHGIVNAIVLLLYAASLYFRYNDPSRPEIIATVFSTIGAGFALVGGWLGGELVERLGVAVHTGAHVDAPSSLSVTRIPSEPLGGRATATARR
ncbi:MAG: DUF2231 domain-containing protein [Acidobacteria bacterium]|nr:DUF2231 domain-containing protein [Acidobacteriota bacterium]